MRFLIVDDAESPLKVLRKIITEMGHQVVGTASNGLDAVEAFHALKPDVVMMDVIMPKLNGLDALKLIFQSDPAAKVIMSCSLNSCQTALEAERLGACFCLSKPFAVENLRNAIRKIAGNGAAPGNDRPAKSPGGADQRPTA